MSTIHIRPDGRLSKAGYLRTMRDWVFASAAEERIRLGRAFKSMFNAGRSARRKRERAIYDLLTKGFQSGSHPLAKEGRQEENQAAPV